MPQFGTEVEYNDVANNEQSDIFFSDVSPPNNFDVTKFPPVYSRTPYVVTPVFKMFRNLNPAVNDTQDYKITRIQVANSQGSANGVVANTSVDYLPWSNSNVLTSSDELVLQSSTGQGSYIIDNFRATFQANGACDCRIDITEQSSPMTDTWNYVNLDYSNGQVLSSEDLPQANTYGGLFKWQEPIPDIIEETFTFTVYGTFTFIPAGPGLYFFSQSWDVDMNVYFDYAPLNATLPTIVSQGRF